VIEDGLGGIVDVEINACVSVSSRTLFGLRPLAAAAGKCLTLGLVLFENERTVPFGERIAAVPGSTPWS